MSPVALSRTAGCRGLFCQPAAMKSLSLLCSERPPQEQLKKSKIMLKECVCVWWWGERRELRVIVFVVVVVVILVFVRHRGCGRRDVHHGGVGGEGHGALGLCWSHAAHRDHVAHVHVLRGCG